MESGNKIATAAIALVLGLAVGGALVAMQPAT